MNQRKTVLILGGGIGGQTAAAGDAPRRHAQRNSSSTVKKNPAAVFRPIGRVEDGVIRVHRDWAPGLDGIEGFSHLIVIYWLDQSHEPELKLHPKGDRRIPALGFLATRTPHRANPIGMTVVRLLKRRGSRLWIEGLDAWPGTPVLDIKPYTRKDSIKKFRIPAWVKLLDQAETDPLRRYAS